MCCFKVINLFGDDITEEYQKEILKAISDGLNVFITGMARGVDYEK